MSMQANILDRGKTAPGPRGHRLIGSLLEVRRDRLKFVSTATRKYGDIVRFRMGPKSLYLLNHPDYAKHILCENQENYLKGLGLTDAAPLLGKGLLTSEGDLWASQRHLLQQAFNGSRMEDFSQSTTRATALMLEHWEDPSATGRSLNIAQEMQGLTLRIVGQSLFRLDLSDVADELIADLALLTGWSMSRMTALVKIPLSIPTSRNVRARSALRRLDRWVSEIIQSRRESPGEGDLVSLLLSQQNGHGTASERQIRDEVLTFLLAGHETTAATLTWVWHLLAQHRDVEEALHCELEQVLAGRFPSLADLPRLVYTKKVVDEVLRLYPPVWLIPRKSVGADNIGGYRVPANSDILLSVFTIHRHKAFWEDPERFNPERFSSESSSKRAPFSYLPFGMGIRTCVGSRFGLMETLLIVATVAQEYLLRPVAEHPVEAEASLTLHPRQGLFMNLHRRG